MRQWRRLDRGFTLVELLVVIGIIALLISILLPSLNKARQSALAVSCSSNMKQLGMAFFQYANDNRGNLPLSHVKYPGNKNYAWDDLIADYLGGGRMTEAQKEMEGGPWESGSTGSKFEIPVLLCPADGLDRLSPDYARRSYAVVMTYHGRPETGWVTAYLGLFGQADYSTATAPNGKLGERSFKLTEARPAVGTLLATEAHTSENRIGSVWWTGLVAPEGRPRGEWRGQMDTFYNIWTGVGANATPKAHPGGKVNYLFADGHVEPMLPKETVGAGTTVWPQGAWTRFAD